MEPGLRPLLLLCSLATWKLMLASYGNERIYLDARLSVPFLVDWHSINRHLSMYI